jgi:hypothetical protein
MNRQVFPAGFVNHPVGGAVADVGGDHRTDTGAGS